MSQSEQRPVTPELNKGPPPDDLVHTFVSVQPEHGVCTNSGYICPTLKTALAAFRLWVLHIWGPEFNPGVWRDVYACAHSSKQRKPDLFMSGNPLTGRWVNGQNLKSSRKAWTSAVCNSSVQEAAWETTSWVIYMASNRWACSGTKGGARLLQWVCSSVLCWPGGHGGICVYFKAILYLHNPYCQMYNIQRLIVYVHIIGKARFSLY